MKTAIVTGGSSGLGHALIKRLSRRFMVMNWDRNEGYDVREPNPGMLPGRLDLLVNCAGINRINWLNDVKESEWDEVMDINAKGIFLMSQMCAPKLRSTHGTILNIVSNAAHMPMRCSAAYNASKGAALILTKQLARELAPEITVFSVSPNKIADTGMSHDIDQQVMKTRGWSPEEAREYQKRSLITGEETPVEVIADFIYYLLSEKIRHKFLAGCDIPYGL